MNVRRYDQRAIVDLTGDLSEDACAAELEALVAGLIADGALIIGFNCEQASFIDWSCASALCAHVLRAQMRGGQLVLTRLPTRLAPLLLDKFSIRLRYVASEEEVLALPLESPAPASWWFWREDACVYPEADPHGQVSVVRLSGALYGSRDAELVERFLTKLKTPGLVLDMTMLAALTPEGLMPLAKLRKLRPNAVAWCKLSGLPLRMLEITGLAKLFPHFDSVPEALAVFPS